MTSRQISRGTFTALLGFTLVASTALISALFFKTRESLYSENRILIEQFSYRWETVLKDEERISRELFEQVSNDIAAQLSETKENGIEANTFFDELLNRKDYERLAIVDSDLRVVSRGSSFGPKEVIHSQVLDTTISKNHYLLQIELGEHGFPMLRMGQSITIEGQAFGLFYEVSIRDLITHFEAGDRVHLGVLGVGQEGISHVFLDFLSPSDPEYVGLSNAIVESIHDCIEGCFVRSLGRLYCCTKFEFGQLEKGHIGSLFVLRDVSDAPGDFLSGVLIICIIFVVGPLVFIVLNQSNLAGFARSIQLLKDDLRHTESERDHHLRALDEKESMFRNLFDGAPIPMIQINFDAMTERDLIRCYQRVSAEEVADDQIGGADLMKMFGVLGEGRIVSVNTAAADMFAISERDESISGMSWFLDMTDDRFKTAIIELIVKRRSFSSFECQFFPKRGARRTILADFTVLNHRKDRDSILVSFQDVTEQKREHEALIEAKEQAEEAHRLKSSFLTNMSHELKTPLNAIIGFSDLLSDVIKDEIHKEQVGLIRSSGRHLLSIIKDILELTRLDTDSGHLNYSLMGLQEFLSDFLHPFRTIAQSNNLELNHLSDQRESVFVFCDQSKLFHILNNLINNSLKFTEKGCIEIDARHEWVDPSHGAPFDHFSQLLNDEVARVSSEEFSDPSDAALCRLVIEIRDTGIGINPDKIRSVFKPFIQGDDSSTRRYGGTGLGLAVCNKLVETMGGELVCQNLDGGGCSFQLSVYAVTSLSGNF